jgi:hypothetical protein
MKNNVTEHTLELTTQISRVNHSDNNSPNHVDCTLSHSDHNLWPNSNTICSPLKHVHTWSVLRRSVSVFLYFSVSHEWTNGDRRCYTPRSLVARENACSGPEKGRFCCFLEQNFFVGDSHITIYIYLIPRLTICGTFPFTFHVLRHRSDFTFCYTTQQLCFWSVVLQSSVYHISRITARPREIPKIFPLVPLLIPVTNTSPETGFC